jgi:ribosomal protein S18 acetylase RimI-like enzyme
MKILQNAMTEIVIIKKRAIDLEHLRRLYFQVRKQSFFWNAPACFTLSDFDKDTNGEYVLIALADNKLVGFISVWLADKFIHHLFVETNCQNKGIGSQLLSKIISEIGYPIKLKCIAKNKAALKFYEKKGFKEIERGFSDGEAFVLLELQKMPA